MAPLFCKGPFAPLRWAPSLGLPFPTPGRSTLVLAGAPTSLKPPAPTGPPRGLSLRVEPPFWAPLLPIPLFLGPAGDTTPSYTASPWASLGGALSSHRGPRGTFHPGALFSSPPSHSSGGAHLTPPPAGLSLARAPLGGQTHLWRGAVTPAGAIPLGRPPTTLGLLSRARARPRPPPLAASGRAPFFTPLPPAGRHTPPISPAAASRRAGHTPVSSLSPPAAAGRSPPFRVSHSRRTHPLSTRARPLFRPTTAHSVPATRRVNNHPRARQNNNTSLATPEGSFLATITVLFPNRLRTYWPPSPNCRTTITTDHTTATLITRQHT